MARRSEVSSPVLIVGAHLHVWDPKVREFAFAVGECDGRMYLTYKI